MGKKQTKGDTVDLFLVYFMTQANERLIQLIKHWQL